MTSKKNRVKIKNTEKINIVENKSENIFRNDLKETSNISEKLDNGDKHIYLKEKKTIPKNSNYKSKNIFKYKYNISYLNFGLNLINNYELMLLSALLNSPNIEHKNKSEIFNIFKIIKVKYLENVNQIYNSNFKIKKNMKSKKRKFNLQNKNSNNYNDEENTGEATVNYTNKTEDNLEDNNNVLDNDVLDNESSSDDDEIQIYNFVNENDNNNLNNLYMLTTNMNFNDISKQLLIYKNGEKSSEGLNKKSSEELPDVLDNEIGEEYMNNDIMSKQFLINFIGDTTLKSLPDNNNYLEHTSNKISSEDINYDNNAKYGYKNDSNGSYMNLSILNNYMSRFMGLFSSRNYIENEKITLDDIKENYLNNIKQKQEEEGTIIIEKCKGRKADLKRCTRRSLPGKDYCKSHENNLPFGRFDEEVPKINKTNKKRGRKRKKQIDTRFYDDNYITFWEEIIGGEKVLIDKFNNVFSYDKNNNGKYEYLGHKTIYGKIDSTIKFIFF